MLSCDIVCDTGCVARLRRTAAKGIMLLSIRAMCSRLAEAIHRGSHPRPCGLSTASSCGTRTRCSSWRRCWYRRGLIQAATQDSRWRPSGTKWWAPILLFKTDCLLSACLGSHLTHDFGCGVLYTLLTCSAWLGPCIMPAMGLASGACITVVVGWQMLRALPGSAIMALTSVAVISSQSLFHWTRCRLPCGSVRFTASLTQVVAMQTTDGLPTVLTDLELRARVYSEPLLPKSDKSVPRPDKAVWKHLTVRAVRDFCTGLAINRNIARMR